MLNNPNYYLDHRNSLPSTFASFSFSPSSSRNNHSSPLRNWWQRYIKKSFRVDWFCRSLSHMFSNSRSTNRQYFSSSSPYSSFCSRWWAPVFVFSLFFLFLVFGLATYFSNNKSFESSSINDSSSSNGSNNIDISLLPPQVTDNNKSQQRGAQQEDGRSIFTHLIIVCGHAVYKGGSGAEERTKGLQGILREEMWQLEWYQEKVGMVETFVSHIARGVALAAADPSALLIFSGGETRASIGPHSEAGSYWQVADVLSGNDWEKVKREERVFLEEYARDSMENLLFSIARFHEVSGQYPQTISLVSFDFKRARFVDHHRVYLNFPLASFHFEGINGKFVPIGMIQAEKTKSLEPYKVDPYGCGKFLRGKRLERDPFHRQHGYATSAPELKELLHYCGPQVFSGPLPWAPK